MAPLSWLLQSTAHGRWEPALDPFRPGSLTSLPHLPAPLLPFSFLPFPHAINPLLHLLRPAPVALPAPRQASVAPTLSPSAATRAPFPPARTRCSRSPSVERRDPAMCPDMDAENYQLSTSPSPGQTLASSLFNPASATLSKPLPPLGNFPFIATTNKRRERRGGGP